MLRHKWWRPAEGHTRLAEPSHGPSGERRVPVWHRHLEAGRKSHIVRADRERRHVRHSGR